MTSKHNTMYKIKIAILIISMLIDVNFQKILVKNDNTKIKFKKASENRQRKVFEVVKRIHVRVKVP